MFPGWTRGSTLAWLETPSEKLCHRLIINLIIIIIIIITNIIIIIITIRIFPSVKRRCIKRVARASRAWFRSYMICTDGRYRPRVTAMLFKHLFRSKTYPNQSMNLSRRIFTSRQLHGTFKLVFPSQLPSSSCPAWLWDSCKISFSSETFYRQLVSEQIVWLPPRTQ